MSRATEQEAKRLENERTRDRCKEIATVFGYPDDELPAALNHLAGLVLAEATYIAEQKRKGWQSTSREYTAAGRILEAWARDLAEHAKLDTPPVRPPLDQIPRHFPPGAPTTQPSIDDKLDAAFGPPPEPVRHIPMRLPAHNEETGESVDITAAAGGPVTEWNAKGEANMTIEPESAAFVFVDPGESSPPLKPFEDSVVRSPAGDFDGTAQFILNDETGPVVTIRIHGKVFTLNLPPGSTAPCTMIVKYRMAADTGEVRIISREFKVEHLRDGDPEFAEYLNAEIGFTPPKTLAMSARGNADAVLTPLTDPPSFIAAGTMPTANAGTPMFSEPSPPPARQTQQRMTFDAVREHGMARARGSDHRSYSQVTAFAECGTKYALSDMDAEPAWWNVGGTALHYAIEDWNRNYGPGVFHDHETASIAEQEFWTPAFGRAISEAATESGVTPDRWRAAKKGHEGYDWWRTEGPVMVGRWVNRLRALYDDGWRIATIDGRPAVELSAPMVIEQHVTDRPIDLPNRSIKVENILDLVMVRGDTFLIIDLKSGASAPDSTYQLGQYGWALARKIDADERVQATCRIIGAYWLARSDTLTWPYSAEPLECPDLRELHPWSEIEYLITTMHQAESQGLYLPNRSRWCVSCGVRGICPVGPS